MSLSDEERQILVNLEKEKALNTFAEIDVLRQAGFWNNIANRLYYAAFHAVSALLIHNRHNFGSTPQVCAFLCVTVNEGQKRIK